MRKTGWTALAFFTFNLLLFAQSPDAEALKNASALEKKNNFKDAFAVYKKLLSSNDKKIAVDAFVGGERCLDGLGKDDEKDAFREEAVERSPECWQMLSAVAGNYMRDPHVGTLIGDSFKRGYGRDGQGVFVSSFDRDRVRALQLMERARAIFEKEGAKDFNFYLGHARILLSFESSSEAWKLQNLTDIATLPDYEKRERYGRALDLTGAPVDADGNPVFYKTPSSFEAAANDGERWRWTLKKAADASQDGAWLAAEALATFFYRQFDVHTINRNESMRGRLAELKDGPYCLHTLSDDETIANLANGVRRIKLPDEFNYIKIYKSLTSTGCWSTACSRLAAIYSDRRQYEKAADVLREVIAKKGRGAKNFAEQLDNIIGNRGVFMPGRPQTAGKNAAAVFRFRNATEAGCEIAPVDMRRVLEDIKKYLKSNPSTIDWDTLYCLSRQKGLDQKYVGDAIKKWDLPLEPLAGHYDSLATIETPVSEPGLYQLTVRLKGGNTSKILIYVTDTFIVRNGDVVFVADAVTGQPVANARLDFFGYAQKNLGDKERNRNEKRHYNVLTQSRKGACDDNGVFLADLNPKELNYSWMATAEGENGRFAWLEFDHYYRRDAGTWQNDQKFYVITDRPVYRPGQKVGFKAWLQRVSYDNDNNPFAKRAQTLKIVSPKGETVLEKKYDSDEFGGIADELALAANADLGVYSVQLLQDSSWYRQIGSFRVEEYKKPEYEVKVEAPSEPCALGGKASVTIRAKYYFGAPVVGAEVKYKILRRSYEAKWYPPRPWDWLYGPGYWWSRSDYSWLPGWSRWGCRYSESMPWRREGPPELMAQCVTKTDAEGNVRVEVDTSLAKALYGDKEQKYDIEAEVVDKSRRTIFGKGSFIAAASPFKVYCWGGRGWSKVGDTIEASCAARAVDGRPVSGCKGEASLFKITYDEKGAPSEKLVGKWTLAIGADGLARQKINASAGGQYRFSCRVKDAKGGEAEGGCVFTVIGGDSGANDFRYGALEIFSDKNEYAEGETARLVVGTARKDGVVMLFVRPSLDGDKAAPEILRLSNSFSTKDLAISKKGMPNFFIDAVTVSDGRVHSVVREIFVPPEKKVLNVEAVPGKKKFKPGEDAEISVKVTDADGKPVTSPCVATIYDKSLEYISGGSNAPDIKAFFWSWKRHYYSSLNSNERWSLNNIFIEKEKTLSPIGVFGEILNDLNPRDRKGGPMTPSAPMPMVAAASKMKMDCSEKKSECNKDADAVDSEAGGAEQDGSAAVAIRENFADTAYWSAAIAPDEKGVAQIKVKMPENLTTWKIRAWSLTGGAKVGEGESEVVTCKDFILRLQAPRFFVEGDEVVLSAVVHNYHPEEKKAEVCLDLEKGSPLALADPKRTPARRTVLIAAGGEARVDWLVRAVSEGEASITMKALTSGDSDGMRMKFPVKVHGMSKMVSFSGCLRPSEGTASKSIKLDVPEKRRAGETRFQLNFSPTLAGAMLDALPYLIAYPYGCTEQTLNRFLPAVITQKTLKDMGVSLSEIRGRTANLNAQELGDKKTRAAQWKKYEDNPVFDEAELRKVVDAGVKRLSGMQNSDGGWGWFSGYGELSYPHTTAQVVRGFMVARKYGAVVPETDLSEGGTWLERYQASELVKLKNAASKKAPWKESPDNMDALVFSTLAEAGKFNAEMGGFLYEKRASLGLYGKALAACGFHLGGDKERLGVLMDNLRQFLEKDEENQTAWLRMPENHCWWFWHGDEIETMAVYLRLLCLVEPGSDTAPGLVKYLLNNRKHSTYWKSTRDTAHCVEAFAEYLRATKEDKPDMTVEVLFDGKVARTEKINAANLFSFDNTFALAGKEVGSGGHEVVVRRTGKGALYFNAYLEYFTLEDFITKAGLEVKVDRICYKLLEKAKADTAPDKNGRPVDVRRDKYERVRLDNNAVLKSGDLMEIELVVESKNDYEYVIFEDMKAAGFEPCEVRSGYDGNPMGAYVEYRDDRVCMFIRHLPRGRHSLSYRVKAEIPGMFSALPAKASAMYAPELRGNSDEIKLGIDTELRSKR